MYQHAWGIRLSKSSRKYKSGDLIDLGRLPKLKIQFADFALWQKERLTGEVFDAQAEYWTRPGKDSREGHSAVWALQDIPSTGGTVSAGHFKNFSSNSPGFEGEEVCDLFGLYARLMHDGDFGRPCGVRRVLDLPGASAPGRAHHRILLPNPGRLRGGNRLRREGEILTHHRRSG